MSDAETICDLGRALNDCLIVMSQADAGDTVAARLAREALERAGIPVDKPAHLGLIPDANPKGPTP